MLIGINVAKLREGKPSQYLTRFLFGGIVTVIATLISTHYGPTINPTPRRAQPITQASHNPTPIPHVANNLARSCTLCYKDPS